MIWKYLAVLAVSIYGIVMVDKNVKNKVIRLIATIFLSLLLLATLAILVIMLMLMGR